MNIIGDVAGLSCILVDDIVDSGGTLCNAAEALLAERPVIASGVQGLAEVVRADVDGVLVPAGDPAALASAVQDVVAQWPVACRRATTARAAAQERFSVDRYHREIVDHLAGGVAAVTPESVDPAPRSAALDRFPTSASSSSGSRRLP